MWVAKNPEGTADLEQLDKPASQKYWDPKDLTNQWKAHNVQEGVGYATE